MLGLEGANSREFDPNTPYPVIDLMDEQTDVIDNGGTMRLGAYAAGSCPARRSPRPTARGRCPSATATATRSNNRYRSRLEDAGLVCSGMSPDDRLVEFIELPAIPSGSAPRPTRSSRAGRTGPIRSSVSWSARR